jgi:hypothetical protein
VSEENSQETKPVEEAKEVKEEGVRASAERANEMCVCGHRASKHTANRYTCQAPGSRKGYCPCMQFVPRSSPIGKRMRASEKSKASSSGNTD